MERCISNTTSPSALRTWTVSSCALCTAQEHSRITTPCVLGVDAKTKHCCSLAVPSSQTDGSVVEILRQRTVFRRWILNLRYTGRYLQQFQRSYRCYIQSYWFIQIVLVFKTKQNKKTKIFKIFRRLRLLEGIRLCCLPAKNSVSCQFSLRLHSVNSQHMPRKRRFATEMQYSFCNRTINTLNKAIS